MTNFKQKKFYKKFKKTLNGIKKVKKGISRALRGLEGRKLKNQIRLELQNSTTHGISYFANNKIHSAEKIFWSLTCILCLFLVALLLAAQYLRFITSPTVMSVEMNYFDWNITYPAIALCPLYKSDSDAFKKIANETLNRTGIDIHKYLWSISQAALDTLEFLDLNAPEDVVAVIHPNIYSTVAASMLKEFKNSNMITNSNNNISVEEAMTEMGMCHIINSNVAIFDKPQYWNNFTPKYRKNDIQLSVYDKDFFIQIMNYGNINKVFIHSPDDVTLKTTSSFSFDVEGHISFGLSVWSTRISEELRYRSIRLRKCRFIHETLTERYPIYSYNHCILECRIRMIKKLCGCVPHFYKTLRHERICYISELQCILDHRKEIVTLATSPEMLKKFRFSKDLPTHSRDCACLNLCELDFYYKDREDYTPLPGENVLSIKISSFPKVRVVRDIIFNIYDIFLRSGGVINLCFGTSIISLMEFFVTIIKILIYAGQQTLLKLFG